MDPLILAGIVAFSVVTSLIAFLIVIRQRRNLKPPSGFLASHSPMMIKTSAGTVFYRYRPATSHRGRETRPPAIEFWVECRSHSVFYLFEKSARDWFYRFIGLAPRLVSRVPEIDSKFYLSTLDPDCLVSFLRDSKVQTLIRKLTAIGFNEFESDTEKILVRWSRFQGDLSGERHPFTETVAEELSSIAKLVQSHWSRVNADEASHFAKSRNFWMSEKTMVSGIIGFVFSLLFAIFPFVAYEPLEMKPFYKWLIVFSAGAMLIIVGPIYRRIRTLGLPERFAMMTLTFSTFFALAFAWGTESFVNGFLDPGIHNVRLAPIVSRWTETHKNSRSYHVAVQSWKDPSSTYHYRVPESQYRSIASEEPTFLKVEIRNGKLGIEWTRRKKVVTAAELRARAHPDQSK